MFCMCKRSCARANDSCAHANDAKIVRSRDAQCNTQDPNYLKNVRFQKISILPPQKGLKFPEGWGVLQDQKINRFIKLNWNFQKGGEVLEKIHSVGEVWIFCGTT